MLYLAVHKIQSVLFDVGAHIATPRDKATPKKIGTVSCACCGLQYYVKKNIVMHCTCKMNCLYFNFCMQLTQYLEFTTLTNWSSG